MLSIVLVVTFVIFINLFIMVGLLIAQSAFDAPIFQKNETSPEQFTRQFHHHVSIMRDDVSITEQGKEELLERQAWIQILNENGQEVYRFRAPAEVQEKYIPSELIQMYKYKEINALTTIFVGEKKGTESTYSYLIGIEDPNINRYFITFDYRSFDSWLKIGVLIFLTDIFIALLIGYFFSKRLTQPLHSLINGIKKLANKDYNINYEPKGLYKDVFYNVNYLSNQLIAYEKERKKLNQMREEWIGNISHDIKTPLASIQGYAEMIRDPDYDFSLTEVREYAEIIEKKSVYIKEVIEDLNLTTRLKNKEFVLNKKTVNIVSLLRSMTIDILNDPKYAKQNIEFQVSQENIPIEVDAVLIRRALTNLIYNAMIHNAPHVKIVVGIEKKERTLITIKDNGRGIKKEELDKIFERYYRGTNTGDAHKGSGLGMAIAKEIIQEHHGEITIYSEVGQGTTIEVQL